MYLLESIDEQIKVKQDLINEINRLREWVEANQEKFNDLPNATIYCYYIDFNSLAHDQVMKVVMRFPGRWKREPNGDRLDYTNKVSDEVTIRCYQGQPPPNCRVEYEEVHVPARTERRPKFVCNSTANALPVVTPKLEDVPLSIESPDDIPF